MAIPHRDRVSLPLKPWREVVTPHRDVASGRYQQAEFAADLWQVHLGEGSEEYRNPAEFYRRTYLTQSLKGLLTGAIRRLTGRGGDPVVQLQTNFGGGKTHSMLALFHLFSGTNPAELRGIPALLEAAEADPLPNVRRVVLVGNKISPGNPSRKADGTVIRTLWGELAWQLGGPAALARIAEDDRHATSPGDVLRELFKEYGPCLILIDEWVAYARQLHDQSDLPAGSFETQFSFAQALTESAKLVDDCLLVISLPASDTSGSPHAQADDVEVGGQRGREALDRLRNVVGRVEATWRPASAEEGFEIVRSRLFEPMTENEQIRDRDGVARAFGELYRNHPGDFPPECQQADYENRVKAAYPIHPEIFDRLYNDWSTLVKFQRTRGVLRLMAAVIHSLWEKGDRSPLILPANISIDEARVQTELTHYLSDNWVPVIEKDVDGPSSLPQKLDNELPNFGKYSAARRVARTIYLGSAPLTQAAHRGVEERRVRLGCMLPGEPARVFDDALRRLAGAATYLYEDGRRYWYSTQPTVTKLAEDRAEQLKRDPDKIVQEIERRVGLDLNNKGDFARCHRFPASSGDVPDDLDARLVALRSDYLYSREAGNAAEKEAKAILEFRGNQPRLYRNSLVFLAADKTRFQDLDAATRAFLAWKSIVDDQKALNLDPQQVRQAENQKNNADATVSAQIPETYQWLLVPQQKDNKPESPVEWQTIKLSGQESLAVRASRKLRSGDLLVPGLAGSMLRAEMDRIPLWRGNDHVAVKQLVEDFARYPYLPRLQDPAAALSAAVKEGTSLATWQKDGFAFAESYDEAAGRYRALRAGQELHTEAILAGLLVRPEVAYAQLEAEQSQPAAGPQASPLPATEGQPRPSAGSAGPAPQPAAAPAPKRFHGSVALDATRVGSDASRIAEEVISHLSSLFGAKVKVFLEIEADIPGGAPEHVVRTVLENSRTLKFTSQGFETE